MRLLIFSGAAVFVSAAAWTATVCAAEAPPAAAAASLPPAAATPVDFLRDVKPLLAARCVACHGENVNQGGLRLHVRADALAGGDNGPLFEPGKSAESRIIRYVAGLEAGKRMPPAGPALTPQQIGVLRAWIDQGARWPDDGQPRTRPKTDHWAFKPVRRPAIPSVKAKAWVRNPIDAFVLARLEKAKIQPSPEADRVTLIRRVYLDLLGLPPKVEEVDAYLADRAPGAYERMVDRVLASPHYGERQARFWLDQARYADSNGYTIDSRRSIWKYRDWVIDALNRDLPFDRFTVEQLAGDLLPDATPEQRVATGFHRNTLINEEGGTDREQFRVEAVVDRVNTTGAVWMGLTVGCAQCHTHKYDPITQREYYQLFAFFNDQDEPNLSFPTPTQEQKLKEIRSQLEADRKALTEIEAAAGDPASKAERARLAARVAELQKQERAVQASVVTTMVLSERQVPRETFVHVRGDFLRKGVKVDPAVPALFPDLAAGRPRPTRLDLARWLVDPAHPLTGRVTVNRIWQQHFGVGLVETENDFGTQGSLPTHPELLDYLASAFAGVEAREYGSREEKASASTPRSLLHTSTRPHPHPALNWSLKALHRLIVTSSTYRQSSRVRPELAEVDPTNKLLARMPRVRLEAEAIRDAALASSGLFSPKIGGPSVFPPQPGGLDLFTQSKKNWTPSKGEDRYRRGLYTFKWRSSPYPLFATFDAPDGNVTCTRRARSNTPLGALMLANDASLFEMMQGLAVTTLKGAPPPQRLRYAFRRCLAREPSPAELGRLQAYYQSQLAAFQAAPSEAEKVAPKERPEGISAAEAAAWASVARVLMNLDEFITRE